MVIFTLLTSFFGGMFSAVRNFFSFLISNPKIAIAIVVLVAVLCGGFYIKHEFDKEAAQITSLQQENVTLVTQNIQLKKDVASAVQVNQNDQTVIQQLSLAKTDAEKRVAEMQTEQKASQNRTNDLQKMIANSKPADDGKVANVLRDTIKAIQANRKTGLGQ